MKQRKLRGDSLASEAAEDLIPHLAVYVTDKDSLDTALSSMIDNELEEIFVVDDNMNIIEDSNLLELISY